MSKDLPPSRTADQFVVRFPDGMRDQIAEAAKANNRSMNAEIVARLQASFAEASLVGTLPGFQMTAQMGPAENEALTPEQLKLAKAVATEAVKQVVALRVEGLDLLKTGVHTAVIGPTPDQGKKAPAKKPT